MFIKIDLYVMSCTELGNEKSNKKLTKLKVTYKKKTFLHMCQTFHEIFSTFWNSPYFLELNKFCCLGITAHGSPFSISNTTNLFQSIQNIPSFLFEYVYAMSSRLNLNPASRFLFQSFQSAGGFDVCSL